MLRCLKWGKYKCIVTVRSMYLDKQTRPLDISDIRCQIDTMLMNGDDRMDARMAFSSPLHTSSTVRVYVKMCSTHNNHILKISVSRGLPLFSEVPSHL